METMLIAGMWLHIFGAHGPGVVEKSQITEPLQGRPGSYRSSSRAVSQTLQEGLRVAEGEQDLPPVFHRRSPENGNPLESVAHEFSGDVEDFGAEHPEKYRESSLLRMRRYWEGPDAYPAEKGSALVGAAEEGLSFYACFTDSDIFSNATADNQRMWTLGDVAEFFVKPGAERSDYWEIHVTPNGYLMDPPHPGPGPLHRRRGKLGGGARTFQRGAAAGRAARGQVGGGGPHPLEGVRPRFSPKPGDGVVLRGLPLQLQRRPGRPGALLQRAPHCVGASTGGEDYTRLVF